MIDGRRLVDRAWMRDKHGNIYVGEALALALLLRAKGTSGRGSREEEYVANLLDKGEHF